MTSTHYTDAPVFWNSVTVFICLVAVSVWTFLYTDWITPILGSLALGCGSVWGMIFGRKSEKTAKEEKTPVDAIARRPEWLSLPLVVFCAWMVSLLWGTVAVIRTGTLKENVVLLHSERTGVRRPVEVSEKWTKVRLPLWDSRVWRVEADEYPQPAKELRSFGILRLRVPSDLLEPQLYIRPTAVLSNTAPRRTWRLLVKKNDTVVTTLPRYRGEGVLYGGTFRGYLEVPSAGVVERPDVSFTRDDVVDVVVEQLKNGQWTKYTGVSAKVEKFDEHKLREIEIDVPFSADVDDDDTDSGDAPRGAPGS